jgi:hypothetical protein
MNTIDLNHNGCLDRREFAVVMRYLSGNLLLRVIATVLMYGAAPLVGSLLVEIIRIVNWTSLPLWMQCGGTVLDDLRLWAPVLTIASVSIMRKIAYLLIDIYYAKRARLAVDMLSSRSDWYEHVHKFWSCGTCFSDARRIFEPNSGAQRLVDEPDESGGALVHAQVSAPAPAVADNAPTA